MPKGIYKRTEEAKRKISEGRKGKLSGMLGKNHTEKTKKKMSETAKRVGKGKWMKNRKLSEEHKRHIGEGKMKLYDRIGRKKYKRYIHLTSSPKYKKWRMAVFQRDNWICQTCGVRSKVGEPVYLEAHHIKSWAKYPKLRYEVNNGITLCYSCHKLTKKI